jgi:hypothetical protein
MGDRVISYYALQAFEQALATNDTDALRKQWPAIKASINLKKE